jgi:hypothetical protein
MNTLVTDDFAEGPAQVVHNYEPHNIVYGSKGWTDALDDGTIDLLMRTGAVRLEKTISGVGFETRIYVTVAGQPPKE